MDPYHLELNDSIDTELDTEINYSALMTARGDESFNLLGLTGKFQTALFVILGW